MLPATDCAAYKMQAIPPQLAKAIWQEYLDRRARTTRDKLEMTKKIMTWYNDLESEVSQHFDKALLQPAKRPRLGDEQTLAPSPASLDSNSADSQNLKPPPSCLPPNLSSSLHFPSTHPHASAHHSPSLSPSPLPSLFPPPPAGQPTPTITYPEYFYYTDEVDPHSPGRSNETPSPCPAEEDVGTTLLHTVQHPEYPHSWTTSVPLCAVQDTAFSDYTAPSPSLSTHLTLLESHQALVCDLQQPLVCETQAFDTQQLISYGEQSTLQPAASALGCLTAVSYDLHNPSVCELELVAPMEVEGADSAFQTHQISGYHQPPTSSVYQRLQPTMCDSRLFNVQHYGGCQSQLYDIEQNTLSHLQSVYQQPLQSGSPPVVMSDSQPTLSHDPPLLLPGCELVSDATFYTLTTIDSQDEGDDDIENIRLDWTEEEKTELGALTVC